MGCDAMGRGENGRDGMGWDGIGWGRRENGREAYIVYILLFLLLLTFIILIVFQHADEDDEKKKEGGDVKSDEELVHEKKERSEEDEMEDIKRAALMPKQPDKVKLEEMRQFKSKQKLMYRILKEIFSYIIFVLILLTIAYGNRDYRSHQVNNALTSYFMGGTYSGKMALGDVSVIDIAHLLHTENM